MSKLRTTNTHTLTTPVFVLESAAQLDTGLIFLDPSVKNLALIMKPGACDNWDEMETDENDEKKIENVLKPISYKFDCSQQLLGPISAKVDRIVYNYNNLFKIIPRTNSITIFSLRGSS